jgi:iron complex outermembrane recepter protein
VKQLLISQRTAWFWTLALFLLLSEALLAQQKLQIINSITENPVEGVNWKFGQQKGSSNNQGMLFFFANETDTLLLSHVNYGVWQLHGTTLRQALLSEKIKRVEQEIALQPVTVLSLHAYADRNTRFIMGVQERLSHDAGALLTQTPAIAVIRKSGTYGFDPVLRGFKYDQLNVVIDGVQCASAACPNRMDPPISQVAPNMIEQVELMKGPYSLRFGNSFGGTINFKSIEPRFVEAARTFGRVSGSYEANGQVARTEGMIGSRGKRYEASLLGAFSTGNDYHDGDGQLVPADFSRGSIGASLGWALAEQQLLRTTITRNFARDTDFPALAMDLRTDDTWLVNVAHRLRENHSATKYKCLLYEG